MISDTDAAWLRKLAITIVELTDIPNKKDIYNKLHQIAGPTPADRAAQTRKGLVRREGNGTVWVWCDACKVEHFLPESSLQGLMWRLPCGSLIRPPAQVPVS